MSLFLSAIVSGQDKVAETFEKCIDKRPSDCGLFRNVQIGRRIAGMMKQDRFITLARSFENESLATTTVTHEHWIEKRQYYVEMMLWGRNEFGEPTRLIIQYNKETKKINIYWREGREWMIKNEDSHIPDKLIYYSQQFRP